MKTDDTSNNNPTEDPDDVLVFQPVINKGQHMTSRRFYRARIKSGWLYFASDSNAQSGGAMCYVPEFDSEALEGVEIDGSMIEQLEQLGKLIARQQQEIDRLLSGKSEAPNPLDELPNPLRMTTIPMTHKGAIEKRKANGDPGKRELSVGDLAVGDVVRPYGSDESRAWGEVVEVGPDAVTLREVSA